VRRRLVAALALLVLLVVAVGLGFAGSSSTIAAGVRIAGVDVGGLSAAEAAALLQQRSEALARSAIEFRAGDARLSLSASQLGVTSDWQAAGAAAVRRSDGFGPLRGFRRLGLRLFGADIEPLVSHYVSAVDYALEQLARAADRPPVDARLTRQGVTFSATPGRAGRSLAREPAGRIMVRSLASLDRVAYADLPVVVAQPTVTAGELRRALRRARTAVAAPVTLTGLSSPFVIEPRRLAVMLDLPTGGDDELSIGGPAAERWFSRLAQRVAQPPTDARFSIGSQGQVRVVPSRPGRRLNVAATVAAVERAAFTSGDRSARLVVAVTQPSRTTAQAERMGIQEVVASYTTTYGGTPGRLHNVQLVSQLIDGALIAPGATFSFNGVTGARNADRGFQEAPVIINGELQNGIGGGVCQVSTTVFNAAYEAGLPITARTNHALYIGHYPLGRDATVNYPDLDLRFVNDTDAWLLLRTFVSAGSLTVNLYGTSPGRRVETTTAPLVVVGKTPFKAIRDSLLPKGTRIVERLGTHPRRTSVSRRVYDGDGKLLYDDTWASSYVGEPTVVRVGTMPRPVPVGPRQLGSLRDTPAGDTGVVTPDATSEATPRT
jgi:vancomycin resistance protein YoaR